MASTETTNGFSRNGKRHSKKLKNEKPVMENVSVVLEDGSRISSLCADGSKNGKYYEDASTLYEAILRGLRVTNNGPCLGTRSGPNREFAWISYQQVLDEAQSLGSGLLELGIKPGQGTNIGIYCKNRQEWVITDFACTMFSMVLVPIYDTFGKDGCQYIITHTELCVVLCDTTEKLSSLLENAVNTPCLKTVICIETPSAAQQSLADGCDISLYTYQYVVNSGRVNSHSIQPPKPTDLSTICYTSGTTGVPKGVMITHGAVIATVSSMLYVIDDGGVLPGPGDKHLCYLPLAHVYEKATQAVVYITGGQVGFYSGDVKLLLSDLQALKPTYFCTVPRLVNRMYDKVNMHMKGSKIKQKLFKAAMNHKKRELEKGIVRNDGFWDRLIFRKMANMLGGHVKFSLITSAPITKDAVIFLRCMLGKPVAEGYGMTETTGICMMSPRDYSAGHVGGPFPGNRVKLVDVPECGYYASDNKGEVCVKSPAACLGYYKRPELTAELIDSDGWIHTGDIGQWLPNGALNIFSRKKDIFKLSQGEYICVEKIENIYLQCPIVLQTFVTGNSLQSYVVAIVVPDPEVLPQWAKSRGLPTDLVTFCLDERSKIEILAEIQQHGTEQGLLSFEQVKVIHLHADQFTVDDGMLTPTLKNKRPVLQQHFTAQIDNMYKTVK